MCCICEMYCSAGTYQNVKSKWKIVRSIISRCVYALYVLAIVVLVTVSKADSNFWYLIIFLLPMLIEALYMAFKRRGNEFKWVSTGVTIYLIAATPCIWIWELQNDRLIRAKQCTEGVCDKNFLLELIIMYSLFVGKWIAPKGQLSHNEHSRLLLVYIGNGGDSISILDLIRANEDEEERNPRAIYFILAVWSWSLFQFVFVTTAVKDMPTILSTKVNFEEEKTKLKQRKIAEKQTEMPGISHINVEIKQTEAQNETKVVEDSSNNKPSPWRLPWRFDNKYFIFYNEIWSLIAVLLFQEVPFFIARLIAIVNFAKISTTTLFFTVKNLYVIILTANRIRVIVIDEKYKWWQNMKEARRQREQQLSGV